MSHRAEVGAGVVPDCVRLRQVAADIGPLFGNDTVAYVHLHNAKQGCFFCRVDRT